MWCLPSIHSTTGVRFRGVMLEDMMMITNDDDDNDDDGARGRDEGAEIASLGGDIVAASVPYRPFGGETEM